MTIMAHTNKTALKGKFEDGDRPIGEDFANLLDSCHNTYQDTDVTITGDINVLGSATVEGDTQLKGKLDIDKGLTVDGAVVLKSTLSVSDSTTIGSTLTVTGAIFGNSALEIKGNAKLKSNLDVDGTADVGGVLTVAGSTNLLSTLNVTGDTTLHDNLTVEKNSALNGALNVTGSTSLQDTLDVTGKTTSGELQVHGPTELDNTLHVKDSAVYDKNVHIKGNLRVDGNAYLSAGAGGSINVGDSDDDSVNFRADVASDIEPDADKLYTLGSESAKWNKIYTNDIIVDGVVDGRDISDDGETLDSVYSTTQSNSSNWDTAHTKALKNEANISIISSASAGWDNTEDIVEDKHNTWTGTTTTVETYSASWEESADIQAVADDVAVMGAVSGDWNDTRTTVSINSGDWEIDELSELKDVNTSGVTNNSILRYDESTSKWVASTTEDERAVGLIQIDDGRGRVYDNETIILIDNSDPINTVTFTSDKEMLFGNNIKNSDWSYTYGTSGLTTEPEIALHLASIIQYAKSNGDLAISAEVTDNIIDLSQDVAGKGGNTTIGGTADAAGLITVTHFTGGENPDAFEDLDDTPGSYSTHAGEFVKVNSSENGLEFVKDDTRATVQAFSASWEESAEIQDVADDVAVVGAASGDWNNVYSFVNSDSATNNTTYNQSTFVNASGDTINGTLSLTGDLSAQGDVYLSDSSLRFAGGEIFSSTDSVNAKSVYTSVNDTSGDWDSVYSSVENTSGDWDSVYASVTETSGDWDSVYSSVENTSGDWDSVYASVTETSGDWNSVYTSVNETSGDWNSVYTSVNETSGDWNSVYTSVNETSGDWNSVYTSVNDTSGDWNSVYTSVNDTSGEWDSVYTSVNDTSGQWNSVYSWVNSDSATNNTDYNQSTFVNASGDTINGTLSLTGDLSAQGDVYLSDSSLRFAGGEIFSSIDSINAKSVYTHINAVSGEGIATLDAQGKLLTTQIPELSITRVHTANNPSEVEVLAPATGIQVGDVIVVASTHDNLIALVDDPTGVYDTSSKDYTGYAKLALPDGLVQTVNGKPGPSVVLNPDDLNDDVTAHKFVLIGDIDRWNETYSSLSTASGTWDETYANISAASGDWDDARTTLSTTSGDWNSAYTSVNDTSGDWNSVYTSVNDTSGDWNSVYTSVNDTSGEWDSVYTTVNSHSSVFTEVENTSAEWNSVYSWVNSDSATNNTDYNQSTFVNASGDTMTGSLEIDGGELEVGGNITLAGDVIHQKDTGTRMSFNDDIITFETNGQEFVTIDGTQPTPDTVIINNPAATAIHFNVKSVDNSNALFINGGSGQVAIGTGMTTTQLTVSGGAHFIHDVSISEGSLNVMASGEYLSGGIPLHDIFSTSTDVHGDLTVHGSISSRDETVIGGYLAVSGDSTVVGDSTVTGDLTANSITSLASMHTLSGTTNLPVSGITQELNIGGHIIQIVNGLIVGVVDE